MDRETLERNLATAAENAIRLAQESVIEELPKRYQFLISDHEKTDSLKKRSPGRPFGKAYHGPFSADQIIDHYWRDGKYPGWLSVEVVNCDHQRCGILVRSEGLLTDNDKWTMELARIKKCSHPPFSAALTVPPFLTEFKNGTLQSRSEKFSIHWRQHYRLSLWQRIEYRITMSPLYARY